MCYNEYNYNQCEYQHQYKSHCQYPNHCKYNIYPIPFMPTDPIYAHAYVPYQHLAMTFPLKEALDKGTLFPELWGVYNPYANYLGGKSNG